MTDSRELEQRIKDLEAEVGALRRNVPRGIRKRASFELFGLPAYDIALGPDPATGALRGHAKGFLAIGDLATGVIAIGGLARGLVALGGVAVGGAAAGVYAVGGAAVGSHVVSAQRKDPEAEAFFRKWGVPLPRPKSGR